METEEKHTLSLSCLSLLYFLPIYGVSNYEAYR